MKHGKIIHLPERLSESDVSRIIDEAQRHAVAGVVIRALQPSPTGHEAVVITSDNVILLERVFQRVAMCIPWSYGCCKVEDCINVG